MKKQPKIKTKIRILTEEEVKHVAQLAKLSLTSTEVKKFQKILSETIAYVERLNRLKTIGISPTSQVTGLENVFREDKIGQSLSQKEALANSKKSYQGYFKVKAIFD